jgi:copper chaperone CopZ
MRVCSIDREEPMTTMTIAVSGMSCGHCVASVREALEAVPGVAVEGVRIGSAAVRLDGEDTTALTEAALAAVREAGYGAAVDQADGAGAAEPRPATVTLGRGPHRP